jgi:hypothetical protein
MDMESHLLIWLVLCALIVVLLMPDGGERRPRHVRAWAERGSR